MKDLQSNEAFCETHFHLAHGAIEPRMIFRSTWDFMADVFCLTDDLRARSWQTKAKSHG
jgi:hypothetical protein